MKTGTDRSALLDCIRTVAILLVLVFHVATRYPYGQLDEVAQFINRIGFFGVDLFFPLSGFLITRYLLTHGGPEHIRTFFLRRFFRIVPLYALAVLVFFLGSYLTGFDQDILHRIWIPATFLTGWFIFADGTATVPFTITWSLSVEEFAYIVIGLFALLSRLRLPMFLVGICLFALGLRFWLTLEGYENLYYFPLTRLDSIAVGGLMAVLLGRVPRLEIWLLGLILVLIGLSALHHILWQTLVFSIISLVTCFLIALFEGPMRNIRSAWIYWPSRIGFYSYFTYLFHFFVLYALADVFTLLEVGLPPFWIMVVLCVTITQALAVLSFRVFEQPLMQFGRSLERGGDPRADGFEAEAVRSR